MEVSKAIYHQITPQTKLLNPRRAWGLRSQALHRKTLLTSQKNRKHKTETAHPSPTEPVLQMQGTQEEAELTASGVGAGGSKADSA